MRCTTANPRLLSGQYAPYAEFHAAGEEYVNLHVACITTVCDLEIWDPNLSSFHPKK